MTMVAIIVLSGSSATKMSPKVMARTERFIGRSLRSVAGLDRRRRRPSAVDGAVQRVSRRWSPALSTGHGRVAQRRRERRR